MRRALAAALVAVAVAAGAYAPTGASAAAPDWFQAAPQGIDVTGVSVVSDALSVATRHWAARGEAAACGAVRVYVAPTDPNGGMWSAANVCYIAVNAESWPIYSRQWADLCVGITHELGHILGHPHDADPYSVMYGGDGHGTPIARTIAASECFHGRLDALRAARRSSRRPNYLTRRLRASTVHTVNEPRRTITP